MGEQVGASDFPLIVGVTGHIRLLGEDIETLRKAVTAVLKEIEKAANGADILLLDSLAPGADQLVADIARRNHPHWRLGVPLPFDEEAYLKTFPDEQARESYRFLTTSKNAQIFDLAHLRGDSDPVEKTAQASHYLNAGLFIGLHSHILIALWDGEPARGEGGTGQIIEYTLQPPLPHGPNQQLEPIQISGAFVYHIQSRDERSTSSSPPPSGTIHRMLPAAWDSSARMNDGSATPWGTFDRRKLKHMVRPLCRIQRDQRKSRATNGARIEKSRAYLFSDPQLATAGTCNANPLNPRTEGIAMRFAETDILANLMQTGARRFALFRLLALVAGVIILEFTTGPVDANPYLLGLYLALVILVTMILNRPYHNLERRYLDYRALAEAFRVFCYMDALGLSDRVRSRHLKSDDEGVDWIASTIAWCRARDLIQYGRTESRADRECLEAITIQWVADQRSYFANAFLRQARMLKRLRILMRSLLAASIAFTAIAIAALCVADSPLGLTPQDFAERIIFLAVASGILAGALRAYIDYRGLEEHLNRYAQMKHTYQNEERALRNILAHPEHPINEALERMVALAEQALQENAGWLALHRDRALDPGA